MIIANLIDIFKNEYNYENINKISAIKIRNRKNGIQLNDLFYYRFLYSQNNMTKEHIVSKINDKNGTHLTRQAYESKENNIPIQIYKNILCKIVRYYNNNYVNKDDIKLIGIDGTYNNDMFMNENLNMGFYDITSGIPIDIKLCGKENKNREVYCSTNYINANIDIFKNNIIVADRAYFTYEFMNFLINNDIKFIIRARGEAKNLNPNNVLKHNMKNYDTVLNVKNNIKIIKYDSTLDKTIYTSTNKKNTTKHTLKIKNNCIIITNLLDGNTYTDEKIMNLYRSRWDIEVFFKYIKSNYKFQHIKEKSQTNIHKMYICELIITYIAKIIEKYYEHKYSIKNPKKGITYKINYTNLIYGIFDSILCNILNDKLTEKTLNILCKSYIKIIQNKVNRSHPRTSKTPFSKWYIKGYHNQTKWCKIIDSIINNTVNELNKNLKTLAKQIMSITNNT